jgi:hypothetical protein
MGLHAKRRMARRSSKARVDYRGRAERVRRELECVNDELSARKQVL